MVPFSKQGKRKPLRNIYEGPHEKRFLTSNVDPAIWSNHKYPPHRHSSSPDLSKCIPRNESLFHTKGMAPEYEPNKESFMRNLGKVRLFQKVPKRKPIFELKDVPEGYEVNLSCISAK